jgi:2-keto-4-pentenoate hydratase/2-oxohepta-3-ene-1,7-dioic acid hydratase in catechol pathway
MRLYNIAGRAALAVDGGIRDVETASGGRFPADLMQLYSNWSSFCDWAMAEQHRQDPSSQPLEEEGIGAPVPIPGQIFAIGVNYRGHAEEAGIDLPKDPMVFTKFPSAVSGPSDTITLPDGSVDFEAELVVVIGRGGRGIDQSEAWEHVAGFTVGQDLSERETQLRPPAPNQFNLGKSFAGFAPIGPCLVTVDELNDPNDLEIGCALNGEEMQKARTSEFVFSIPQLIASLSGIVELRPGDLIFTGTPSGVGWTRDPRRLITEADVLTTYVEGLGEMRHHFTSNRSTSSTTSAVH